MEMAGVGDKRQITAVFLQHHTRRFPPCVQLIYQGKSQRCHPRHQFPSRWDITHVENVRHLLGDRKPAIVIIDNFKAQITAPVNALLEEHNIHVCLLPANTTNLLQPMDISVNTPAKDFLKRKFQEWYSNQVMEQLEGQDIEMSDI